MDGTLHNASVEGIAGTFPGSAYGTMFSEGGVYVDEAGFKKSVCEIVGGAVTFQNGADTVFQFMSCG